MGQFGLANLCGALATFLYLAVLTPDTAGRPPDPDDVMLSWITFVGFMGFVMVIGFVLGLGILRRSLGWLTEGRRPYDAERERVLQVPWTFVVLGFVFWMLAAVVFSVQNHFVLDNPWQRIVRNSVGTMLGGMTTCAVTFLLVERTMRPVFASALAGEPPPRERYLGIRPRLMLSWALGSGVPFFGIGVALTRPGGAGLTLPLAFLTGVGLIAGWFTMFVAARSVAEPLEQLRDGVRRVGEGDLDVTVAVDDGGEVGLLQAGVNHMVAGLREQQRIRDLFGRHVGVQVARQALERTGLGGEQRVASALFVDLIGSTGLAQQRPVGEVVATLNALFGAVVAVVGTEGGWVNKFEGDGALCVFGAPIDQPDHAARALRAARELHQELVRLRAQFPALDAGIGVSCGTVVAGNVGAEARYEYTVIGDPVNEAARLTEHAKARECRVLAAESAVAAGGEEAGRWRKVGEFPVRGRTVPVIGYEPVFDNPH
jgi:adenylate cyclase